MEAAGWWRDAGEMRVGKVRASPRQERDLGARTQIEHHHNHDDSAGLGACKSRGEGKPEESPGEESVLELTAERVHGAATPKKGKVSCFLVAADSNVTGKK